MESLEDLLGQRTPKEPPEVTAIKRFIFEEFGAESSVSTQDSAIIITVGSSGLANTLRLRVVQLREAAGTDKRILFRIG